MADFVWQKYIGIRVYVFQYVPFLGNSEKLTQRMLILAKN